MGLNKKTIFGRPNGISKAYNNLESSFDLLTIIEVRKLAYQLAEKYQLPHRFNKENK